jgi:tetratricopeptide (TPR) repeat protein
MAAMKARWAGLTANNGMGRRGVSFQTSRLSLAVAVAMTGVLCLGPARMLGQAAAPATQEPQKNWKDRAEYDLFDAITKDTVAKSKLEKLQQWEKQYPTTDYADQRQMLFLTTYVALNQPQQAVDIAKQILAKDPKNFSALYYIMFYTRALAGSNPTPDVLDQGDKAAKAIIENINTPPPNVTEEQWKTARTDVENLAHTNLGWIELQRKNWEPAEAEFLKSLQINPNNGEVDYLMGTALATEKKVEKMPTALFYFARAATYDGPGGLNPDGRKQVLAYVQRAYKTYHGADDGFNDLIAAAKSSPMPPADGVKIEDAQAIAQRKDKEAADVAAKNPELTLWKTLKAELTGPNGASYFESSMKGAQVTTLKGKVVSLTPALKPKTIVLSLEDGTTPDATLKFEAALAGKVDVGTELSFEGVPVSYTSSPFMVVFAVEKDKLHGWTGKNAPAAPVHHRPKAAAK